jgi:leader peptidase (prepilin peptidase)/N-methyltransferase
MLALACAVLGALVGAVVPWPAYRLSVDYGSPVRSTCPHCDGTLAGWVRVPARCPGCGSRLGPPPWLYPSVGALAFGGLGWALGGAQLAAYLIVAGFGLVLAAIDVACLRLPDPLVGTAFLASGAVLLGVSIVDGSYGRLLRAVLAALAMAAVYLVLALLPGANLGLGDVKLAGVLGLLLGWLGWPAVLLGLFLPHLINGPVALVLLVTGRAKRGASLPLGPALLAGWVLAVVLFAGWHGWPAT